MLLVAALSATLLASCSDSGDEDEDEDADAGVSTGCVTPPNPPPTLTGPAALFDLDGIADVIKQGEDSGSVTIDALADGPITQLAIDFQDVVTNAGFQISGNDAEADEAEVFFNQGDIGAGQVRLRNSDCAGKVDVHITVLDDPSVLPTSS